MTSSNLPYVLTLFANMSFALASIGYAIYSRKNSVLWMNYFKALTGMSAFAVTLTLLNRWQLFTFDQLGPFLLSGLIGFNIGDLFLLKAYTLIGASRALILYGFQPLFIGVSSYLIFDQYINSEKLIAIFFLVGCLFIFSLESKKRTGSWGIQGLLLAIVAVSLDSTGVLLTRYGFEQTPNMTPLEGNFYRSLGAVLGFLVVSKYAQPNLVKNFVKWNVKTRIVLIGISLLGTYIALGLYLQAIQIGHLASITAITITGPMFAALFESIIEKRPPSIYLLLGLTSFIIGFCILIF